MVEILPNLLPPAFTLFAWLLAASSEAPSRTVRGLAKGFLWAFVVTFVAAVPAFGLAASNGFRGLEMAWMLTLILALGGAGAGLLAFIVGFASAYSQEDTAA